MIGKFLPAVREYIAGLLAGEDGVDDLAQETGLFLWQKRTDFVPGTNFRAWARTIALHLVLNHRRAEQRRPFAVTISGVVAEAPTAGLAAYSASKAALHSFVRASAREYKKAGILLLDARPGHTETALSQHPLAGTAPRFGAGHSPESVAARIVRAVEEAETDLPPAAFDA